MGELRDGLIEAVALAQSLHTNGHAEDYARDDAERGAWDEHAGVAVDAVLDYLEAHAGEWMRQAGFAYVEDPFSGTLAPGKMLAVLRPVAEEGGE